MLGRLALRQAAKRCNQAPVAHTRQLSTLRPPTLRVLRRRFPVTAAATLLRPFHSSTANMLHRTDGEHGVYLRHFVALLDAIRGFGVDNPRVPVAKTATAWPWQLASEALLQHYVERFKLRFRPVNMTSTVPQDISDPELVQLARIAMKRAYCPYSNFPVGAVVLTESGETIFGCNVENASYGGTICAERSAIVSAVSQGHRKFRALALATGLKEPARPCGLCRQFLVEFGDFKVIIGTSVNEELVVTSSYQLLPHAFTPKSLETFDEEQKKIENSEAMESKETAVAAASS